VGDGAPPGSWRSVGERFAFLHDDHAPDVLSCDDLSSFDPDSAEYAPIWSPPRFDAPQLGLTAATAGEIVVATCSLYGQEPSLNRIYFNLAAGEQGDDALSLWLACLQTGDAMAHFGLGYTLYELGRFHEAYRHLRYYAEISPGHPWNWCWLGKAAEAIGETAEARRCYERAIELEEAGAEETEAMELMARLAKRERS
jgi:tetratricopeptide (TPR) repeat protein